MKKKFEFKNISGLHLELTTKCNAMCPMCNRNFKGKVRDNLPIYESSLKDIYESNYFEEIRKMSSNVNEECKRCVNLNCKSGCLGQKMLDIIKKSDDQITTKWYQENALRTINNFENIEILRFNAYTGIIGEYGEFFDYIKKLYTHNLTEEKKQEILKLAPNELGDLIWYLSTSLALYYDYTLDEIYNYIISKNEPVYNINKDLIEKASQSKDPLCQFNNQKSYSVNLINDYLEYNDKPNIFELLMNFKRNLNKLDYVDNKEDIIPVVATIFLNIAYISKLMFDKDLSQILEDNIDKLRKRYPEGFSTEVANQRIDANKKYKEEQDMKVKRFTKNN